MLGVGQKWVNNGLPHYQGESGLDWEMHALKLSSMYHLTSRSVKLTYHLASHAPTASGVQLVI